MVMKVVVEHMKKVKKAVPVIEEKIKIHVGFGKGFVSLKGSGVNEYTAEQIIRAIDFGFELDDALLLLDSDFVLEFIDVKEHTNRGNLKDVRARLIGRNGKVLSAFENLTGGALFLRDNTVGLIVNSEHLDALVQAIVSLLRGAKHGNVFGILERQNARIRDGELEDLGLRDSKNYELLEEE